MNDDNKQFLTRHAEALSDFHSIPDEGKFTDVQLVGLTTHPKRAVKIAEKEQCVCASLTKLVEAIENRDFAMVQDLIEPAQLEIYSIIDGTSLSTTKANGVGIDLDFARRTAAKWKANQDEIQKRFEESQQFQLSLDRYDFAWNAWSGTWKNIALSRNGSLIGEVGEGDLTASLNGLVEVIRDRGYIDNLPLAVERFDPSYCDGTDDEEEAHAVKILLQTLNAVASGTGAGEVAAALLSLDPLPPLFRAGSIRHLLRIADLWPNHCENCERIQPPKTFDCQRCLNCVDIEGKLGAIFRCIAMGDKINAKEKIEAPTVDQLFPFWSDWRTKLQSAFPGANGDIALMNRWTNYMEKVKGIQPLSWQYIPFSDASKLLPTIDSPTQDLESGSAVASFRPEDCDDDLWFQLNFFIEAMEEQPGKAWYPIEHWNIATPTEAKYLQNIEQLSEKAGWEPFVFASDEGLGIRRINGETVCCKRAPLSFSKDVAGGEAVLSALRAWRAKRSRELQERYSGTRGEEPNHGDVPSPQEGPEGPAMRILNLYSNNIADERMKDASKILAGDGSTNDKLEQIDAIFPIPPTASAEALGKAFGVSRQAVASTSWWRKKRRGASDDLSEKRREIHEGRAKMRDDINDE